MNKRRIYPNQYDLKNDESTKLNIKSFGDSIALRKHIVVESKLTENEANKTPTNAIKDDEAITYSPVIPLMPSTSQMNDPPTSSVSGSNRRLSSSSKSSLTHVTRRSTQNDFELSDEQQKVEGKENDKEQHQPKLDEFTTVALSSTLNNIALPMKNLLNNKLLLHVNSPIQKSNDTHLQRLMSLDDDDDEVTMDDSAEKIFTDEKKQASSPEQLSKKINDKEKYDVMVAMKPIQSKITITRISKPSPMDQASNNELSASQNETGELMNVSVDLVDICKVVKINGTVHINNATMATIASSHRHQLKLDSSNDNPIIDDDPSDKLIKRRSGQQHQSIQNESKSPINRQDKMTRLRSMQLTAKSAARKIVKKYQSEKMTVVKDAQPIKSTRRGRRRKNKAIQSIKEQTNKQDGNLAKEIQPVKTTRRRRRRRSHQATPPSLPVKQIKKQNENLVKETTQPTKTRRRRRRKSTAIQSSLQIEEQTKKKKQDEKLIKKRRRRRMPEEEEEEQSTVDEMEQQQNSGPKRRRRRSKRVHNNTSQENNNGPRRSKRVRLDKNLVPLYGYDEVSDYDGKKVLVIKVIGSKKRESMREMYEREYLARILKRQQQYELEEEVKKEPKKRGRKRVVVEKVQEPPTPPQEVNESISDQVMPALDSIDISSSQEKMDELDNTNLNKLYCKAECNEERVYTQFSQGVSVSLLNKRMGVLKFERKAQTHTNKHEKQCTYYIQDGVFVFCHNGNQSKHEDKDIVIIPKNQKYTITNGRNSTSFLTFQFEGHDGSDSDVE